MFTVSMQQYYFLRLWSENTLKGINSCKPQIRQEYWSRTRRDVVQYKEIVSLKSILRISYGLNHVFHFLSPSLSSDLVQSSRLLCPVELSGKEHGCPLML